MHRERLTIQEMQERYPEQWVRLEDVEYDPTDHITVQSGVVAKIGVTTKDYIDTSKGLCQAYYIEGNRNFHVGAVMV